MDLEIENLQNKIKKEKAEAQDRQVEGLEMALEHLQKSQDQLGLANDRI